MVDDKSVGHANSSVYLVLHSRGLFNSLNSLAHEDWENDFKGDLTTLPPSLVCPNPSHSCMSFSISTQLFACMIHVRILIHPVVESKLLSHLKIVE